MSALTEAHELLEAAEALVVDLEKEGTGVGKTVQKVTVTYTDGTSEDFSAAVATSGGSGSPVPETAPQPGNVENPLPAPGATE